MAWSSRNTLSIPITGETVIHDVRKEGLWQQITKYSPFYRTFSFLVSGHFEVLHSDSGVSLVCQE